MLGRRKATTQASVTALGNRANITASRTNPKIRDEKVPTAMAKADFITDCFLWAFCSLPELFWGLAWSKSGRSLSATCFFAGECDIPESFSIAIESLEVLNWQTISRRKNAHVCRFGAELLTAKLSAKFELSKKRCAKPFWEKAKTSRLKLSWNFPAASQKPLKRDAFPSAQLRAKSAGYRRPFRHWASFSLKSLVSAGHPGGGDKASNFPLELETQVYKLHAITITLPELRP